MPKQRSAPDSAPTTVSSGRAARIKLARGTTPARPAKKRRRRAVTAARRARRSAR